MLLSKAILYFFNVLAIIFLVGMIALATISRYNRITSKTLLKTVRDFILYYPLVAGLYFVAAIGLALITAFILHFITAGRFFGI